MICSDQWVTVGGVVIPDEAVDHSTIGSFYTRNEIRYSGDPLDRANYFIDDVVVALVTDLGCITGLGDVPPITDDANNKANGDHLTWAWVEVRWGANIGSLVRPVQCCITKRSRMLLPSCNSASSTKRPLGKSLTSTLIFGVFANGSSNRVRPPGSSTRRC